MRTRDSASLPSTQPARRGSAEMEEQIPNLEGSASRVDPTTARYQLGPVVGSGGMGRVFAVEDRDLGRTVAVKTIHPDWRDPLNLTRFINEARATSQLQHPNILSVYDLGIDGQGTPFYTMPLVTGRTLSEVVTHLQTGDLAAHQEFSLARRLLMLQQLCEAIQYTHDRGVLHRDIKPENVMVGTFGELYLMDWGLASGSLETASDQVVGTPGYMAPELLSRGESTQSGDLYSLGALSYELLTLTPAHPGDSLPLRLAANLKTPRAADALRHPGQGRIPKEISNIVMRLLHTDPARRFASAREVRAAIQDYLDGEAPVTCLCTGAKRATFEVGHLIDQLGSVAVVLAGAWLVLPLLFLVLLLTGVLHYG